MSKICEVLSGQSSFRLAQSDSRISTDYSFYCGHLLYWFGIANRYIIFLYGHAYTGSEPAQPFGLETSNRYWMAGFVATAFVLVFYPLLHYLWSLIMRRKQSSIFAPWWYVWIASAIPISIGIMLITMTVNTPTLPLFLALACVIATLIGLAIALWLGRYAIEQPRDFFWLIADGIGLMILLLLLKTIEIPSHVTTVRPATAWSVALGSLVVGVIWLVVMSMLRIWRRKTIPTASALLLAGCGLSYLLIPSLHYLIGTPSDYRYISTASNFFAFSPILQIIIFLVVIGLAFGITNWRHWLMQRPTQRI